MLALVLAAAIGITPVPRPPLTPRPGAPPAHTRIYYIAADEVLWDYTPSGMNQITGRPFDAVQQRFTTRGPQRIGSKSWKALYREYTDSTFRALKPRAAGDDYLGFLGPVIRAEVGDTITVVFRNHASHPFSVHPHGVFYDKDSEGAGYADSTAGADKADDGVPPGGTHTYTWIASERSGPGPMDGSSVLWMYHSHVNEGADVNAGLIGPMIITARGKARPDGSPKDVDREVIIALAEMDENLSWYIDRNIRAFTLDPASVRPSKRPTNTDPFGQTNLRLSINGFLYGNGPMPAMRVGARVRWYLMATTNFEVHAAHWHGNVVTAMHMRTDVVPLVTMGMVVADMVPDNPGTWLFHCHVEPHLAMGMQARYTVAPAARLARRPRTR